MVQHTSPCTHAAQSVEQVTALDSNLGIGTRANPGPGDQVIHINVLGWSAKNNDDTYTTPGNAATQATGINPRIAWQQTIKDPNFSGLSGYDDEMNGAFTYCHGAHNNSGTLVSPLFSPMQFIRPEPVRRSAISKAACLMIRRLEIQRALVHELS